MVLVLFHKALKSILGEISDLKAMGIYTLRGIQSIHLMLVQDLSWMEQPVSKLLVVEVLKFGGGQNV